MLDGSAHERSLKGTLRAGKYAPPCTPRPPGPRLAEDGPGTNTPSCSIFAAFFELWKEIVAKLAAILDRIDWSSVLLPEFQRGYMWNRDQVRWEDKGPPAANGRRRPLL